MLARGADNGILPDSAKNAVQGFTRAILWRLVCPVWRFSVSVNSSGHWNSSARHCAVRRLIRAAAHAEFVCAAAGIRIYERARVATKLLFGALRRFQTFGALRRKLQKRVSGFPRVRVLPVRPACRFSRTSTFFRTPRRAVKAREATESARKEKKIRRLQKSFAADFFFSALGV